MSLHLPPLVPLPLLLPLLLLLACPTSAAPSLCTSDSDCPARYYCDLGEQRCDAGCRSNADCAAGELCHPDTRECLVAGGGACTQDLHCPPGFHCDVAKNQCEAECAPTPCQVHADCPPAQRCREGECRLETQNSVEQTQDSYAQDSSSSSERNRNPSSSSSH